MYLTRNVEPEGAELDALLKRAVIDRDAVRETVRGVLEEVRKDGDQALFALEKQFDKADLATLRVREAEMKEADGLVPDDLKKAILHAASNIRAFHQAEVPQGEHLIVQEGVELSRKIVPIQTVGLYIPGGTAPLFSTVLMLSIPAQVAGCPRIVLATPPGPDGKVNPAILFAASVGGVHEVYKLGGSQAIAALAFGTASVPKVDKIFGPGNRFVMEAKLQVSSEICAIDMPAGPSEVMVIADEKSNPAFVASDLLSQAEHGPDSQAMLLVISPTDGSVFLDAVESAMDAELSQLPRKRFLLSSLSHSHAIVVHTEGSALAIANRYAPEHLIINTARPRELLSGVVNAGSVFLGPYSCESAGDYASGTNHTLPTSGWAHSTSGVSVDSFVKKITVQELSRTGLEGLSQTIQTMARGEQLEAHRMAVAVRMEEKE
ncbi:MAG: histidinol dehydrogenase [Sphaerochaeta sp.]|jgi:histidinol dehydrogenase|nr:histidinol dehydrogenase [Sphaerochaeta sp.]MCI2076536.1 histidinol dehydrogenase [Sphaerochaeta sp.]